jgi:SAM-dependent methyltransferase
MELLSQGRALRVAQEFLIDYFRGRKIRIYEAGGGSESYLPSRMLEITSIVVVDVDAHQLKANDYAYLKILGDIQTCSFVGSSFDLVVCYNVIEHLDAPDKAIRQFYNALAPGGLVFIGAPNPRSIIGFVTRYTPHWAHVAFYRYILGSRRAGEPGHAPFPTIYHSVVWPDALKHFCSELGFEVAYFREYRSWHYDRARSLRFLRWPLNTFMWLLTALSLQRRDARVGDYHIILKKLG